MVANEKIGVVLPSLDSKGYDYAVEKLTQLFETEESIISERCRKIAEENFSLKNIAVKRYQKVYSRLLNK